MKHLKTAAQVIDVVEAVQAEADTFMVTRIDFSLDQGAARVHWRKSMSQPDHEEVVHDAEDHSIPILNKQGEPTGAVEMKMVPTPPVEVAQGVQPVDPAILGLDQIEAAAFKVLQDEQVFPAGTVE